MVIFNRIQRKYSLFVLMMILSLFAILWNTPSVKAESRIFEMGDTEERIAQIQKEMTLIGYPVTISGVLDYPTLEKIMDFQYRYGLVVEGRLNLETQALLHQKYLEQMRLNTLVTAKKHLGVPYVWGGTTPKGFDCSGFTQYVYKEQGINLPRVAADQSRVGTTVSLNQIKAGDLLFFSMKGKEIDHVGIYSGIGTFIHSSIGVGVAVMPLSQHWKAYVVKIQRLI